MGVSGTMPVDVGVAATDVVGTDAVRVDIIGGVDGVDVVTTCFGNDVDFVVAMIIIVDRGAVPAVVSTIGDGSVAISVRDIVFTIVVVTVVNTSDDAAANFAAGSIRVSAAATIVNVKPATIVAAEEVDDTDANVRDTAIVVIDDVIVVITRDNVVAGSVRISVAATIGAVTSATVIAVRGAVDVADAIRFSQHLSFKDNSFGFAVALHWVSVHPGC